MPFRRYVWALFAFLALLYPISLQAEANKPLLSSMVGPTKWVNQVGSVATLYFDTNTGTVTGTYVNNAPGFQCQGTPYPLSGWILSDFISFSVTWINGAQNCNSVTGWTGYAFQSGNTIKLQTNWNLAYQGANGPTIQAGQDVFTYVLQTSAKSLKAK